jgi:RimJ/RimL family protein N-acetyltransferase
VKLVTDQPGEPPVIWQWMHKQNNVPWSSDLRTIGVMREDGSIAAAVGYNGWQENSVWMHVAFDSPHAFNKSLLRAAFDYPFQHCGKEAVYAQISQDNGECLRLVRKLGYREVFRSVDCVMFEMKSGECRWIKEKEHGQEFSAAAA